MVFAGLPVAADKKADMDLVQHSNLQEMETLEFYETTTQSITHCPKHFIQDEKVEFWWISIKQIQMGNFQDQ